MNENSPSFQSVRQLIGDIFEETTTTLVFVYCHFSVLLSNSSNSEYLSTNIDD